MSDLSDAVKGTTPRAVARELLGEIDLRNERLRVALNSFRDAHKDSDDPAWRDLAGRVDSILMLMDYGTPAGFARHLDLFRAALAEALQR